MKIKLYIAHLFHWGALFFFFVAWFVLATGGYRGPFLGLFISARHLTNPVLFTLILTLLGLVLERNLTWRKTPLGKLLHFFIGSRSSLRLTLLLVFILATAFGASGRLYYKHHRDLAEKTFAAGEVKKAAMHYKNAARWPFGERERMRARRAYMLYGAKDYQTCIDELWPRYINDEHISGSGYLWLWSCLIEVKRYQDALDVTRKAMAKNEKMATRCTAVIADLERRISQQDSGIAANTQSFRIEFKFPYTSEHTQISLRGNWDAQFRPSEIHGWQTVLPMTKSEQGWVAQIALAKNDRMPYALIAESIQDDGSITPVGAAYFYNQPHTGTETVTILPLKSNSVTKKPMPTKITKEADGKRRVVAIWPDAGSWFFINSLLAQGLLPNIQYMKTSGVRGEMLSTDPPFTSTAYLKMVKIESPDSGAPQKSSWLDVIALQLKGLPFLDSFFADEIGSLGADPNSIFNILAKADLKAINLVFSDKYLAAPGDGKLDTKRALNLSENSAAELTLNDIYKTLQIDVKAESERAQVIADNEYFIAGFKNNVEKAQAGLDVWKNEKPDFMLLRFPAVDLLSHRYVSSALENPTQNLLLETYKQLDLHMGYF